MNKDKSIKDLREYNSKLKDLYDHLKIINWYLIRERDRLINNIQIYIHKETAWNKLTENIDSPYTTGRQEILDDIQKIINDVRRPAGDGFDGKEKNTCQ
jgi:hypothetical protein